MTPSMIKPSAPYFLPATSANAATMNSRSSSVGVVRWSPSTAIGVSQESQSSSVNRNGRVKRAYQGVYSVNSQRSHFAMLPRHSDSDAPQQDLATKYEGTARRKMRRCRN